MPGEKLMANGRNRLACFKAYDIRGRIPDELNRDLVFKIGRAYATYLKPRRVAVGYDIRLSSPDFALAVTDGLNTSGVNVLDLGVCGTEQLYFATAHLGLDGGVMITASHNPADYNGLKLVREAARPLSGDHGLPEIEQIILGSEFVPASGRGTVERVDLSTEYVNHLMGYVDRASLRPFKIVTNAGNGGAGLILDRIGPRLPCKLVKIHNEADGNFPNGIPNPLLPEKRAATAEVVLREGADLGIAWDGDFDRCFLFDERGVFIEGYYIVGLLASQALKRHPGSKIVHDARLTWNTIDIVRESGGVPVQSKSGHAFMKEVMRREDAVYGGEMSAHHFFREFAYCDSGMIPWLMVLEIMSTSGMSLSELVGERMHRFPASGEINRRLDDPVTAIRGVRAAYEPKALSVDETDGIGLEFDRWRFNVRMSNTEPFVRLNVESRADEALLRDRTKEVLAVLGSP